MLQKIADRLRNAVRQSDTVARMGGDEFMLIFENVTGIDDVNVLGRKIKKCFRNRFSLTNTASRPQPVLASAFIPRMEKILNR